MNEHMTIFYFSKARSFPNTRQGRRFFNMHWRFCVAQNIPYRVWWPIEYY